MGISGKHNLKILSCMICMICHNNEDNQAYTVREMMFGYRDEFVYFQCSNCGCLQIQTIPQNIEKYYPGNYWNKPKKVSVKKGRSLKSWLNFQRSKYLLGSNNVLGKYVSSFTTVGNAPVWSGWNWVEDFKAMKIGLDAAILDVGCGAGLLLYYLRKQGFSNLTGIEPYLNQDTFVEGIKIYSKELSDIDGQFDFITLHHSFEHMAEPQDIFEQLYRLLKPQRYLLLRIPVVSSFAWEKYKVNCAQLDAPRHFFLHTPKSIQILCEQTGFQITNIIYDSTEFQFWASEQYLKDIPLNESSLSDYSPEEIETFRTKSEQLNQDNLGDQACFYLYKP